MRTAGETPRNARIHTGAKRALANIHTYGKKLAAATNLGESENFASA